MNWDKLDWFFDPEKLRDLPTYPNYVWDEVRTITPEEWDYLFRRLRMYDIGWAVARMREGLKVTRKGWNGKDQYLKLQVPDNYSFMSLPYVYISTVSGDLVPWICSQTDLLANDWEVVP